MRADAPFPYTVDLQRSASIILHPTATFLDIINGTATGGFDLAPYADSCRHGMQDASIRMRWHDTLLDNQPRPGHLVELRANGALCFIGVIETVNEFREERGNRSIAIQVRSRDTIGIWRNQRITTARYPIGTNLSAIITDVLDYIGLTDDEYFVEAIGHYLPHTNAQLADMSAWTVLELLLMAIGSSPYVDALGRFKPISRDVTRPADLVLTKDQVLNISGSKARPPVTVVKVRWLDKNLTKVVQQDQVLHKESITAGFFKLKQERDTYWSEDRRSRAESTYMRVIASVNDGLLPVGDEEYTPINEFQGKITVTTSAWVPGLATASIAYLLALDSQPDYAPQAPSGVLPTIPSGRIARGIAETAVLLIMMSLGAGVYEIWGQPYDYVHQRNTTEAYNVNVPEWMGETVEIENDFLNDEAHAQSVAVRELLYGSAEANSWGVVIRDDLRIERGDILELPDGSRLYVMNYERDLSRGAKAELKVEGFRV